MTDKFLENSLMHHDWYEVMKAQLEAVGFGETTSVPFYECSIAGKNLRPDTPKPPMLIPVVQPSDAFLKEHGQYGRYDSRSHSEEAQKLGIQSLEQEEGLATDNGVFSFEMFSFQSHMRVLVGGLVADHMIEHQFTVTDAFTSAVADTPDKKKLIEIANTINNAANRCGLDVSDIDSAQWAAIFRHDTSSMVIGRVNLPDYEFNVVSGVLSHRFPMQRIAPTPLLHSIVSQIHTRPVMEGIYNEPATVFVTASPK
jgi:hypothetical protein